MAFNWPHGLAARLGTDTGHSIGPFSTTLRRASPTCATVKSPAGPLRGRLGPLPPPVRAGRPDCLADLAFGGTLRVLFPSALPAVAWGRQERLAALAPPLCVGSLRETSRAACGLPCRHRLRYAPPPLPSGRYAPFIPLAVTGLPLVGLASARLSPRTHPALPSSLRSVVGQAVSGFDSLRSLHSASLRSGHSATSPFGEACKPGGQAPSALAGGATPPAHGRALGRPETDDGGGRFAPCALPSVGHRLSVSPWRLPRRSASLRARLTGLRQDGRCAPFAFAPRSTWLSLPAVARPCRRGTLACLAALAIRPSQAFGPGR